MSLPDRSSASPAGPTPHPVPSLSPDAFWYRISSPPCNDQDYAPANTFLKGDPATGFLHRATGKSAPVHNTDFPVTT